MPSLDMPARARTDLPAVPSGSFAASVAPLRTQTSPLDTQSSSQQPQQQQQRRQLHHRLQSSSLFGRPPGSGTASTSGGEARIRGEKEKRDKEKESSTASGGSGGAGGALHSYRQHARDAVLHSAIDLRRRGGGGGGRSAENRSKDKANRNDDRAVTGHTRQLTATRDGVGALDGTTAQHRIAGPHDIARAKDANVRRETFLRDMLAGLEETGMSRTRQLDDTYYTILEKASVMRSTLSGLQTLADEVARISESFNAETSTLEHQTDEHLHSFGGLEQQEETIEKLVQQLRSSRQETEKLNERLEGARLRVECYEKAVSEREATRRTRWSVAGVLLAAVVGFVIAVLLAKNRRAVGHRLDTVGHQLAWVGDAVEEVALPLAAKLRARPSPSEDPFLSKLFDDL